jgi:NAD(P)-dependent dehydrogenase (short-subunit alcohol dehydrogenase family)
MADKVVLISGTGGGQGRAAARIFAEQGAKVVGCDINADTARETAEMVRAAGLEMVSAEGSVDLADPEQAGAWVLLALETFGRVDCLYNNASLPRFAPFGQMSVEDYEFTLRNEIDLVWHPSQAAWAHLADSPSGNIVNIGSIAGIVGLRRMPEAAHALTKGAIIGLTAQLAAEGASVGIRVNCISPGTINSPPVQEIMKQPDSPLLDMVATTASGKLGEPEDIVYAALYFASDEAKWTTGAHLVVDGGSSVLI